MDNPILPGATIGILGGGQLGRMMAIAARRMGFRVHCLDPQPDCPAAPVCDLHEAAEYSDLERVAEFARRVDVVTFEFENIPAAAAATAAELRPVRPSPAILEICQHRAREKAFLSSRGFACARHWLVKSAKELCCVIEALSGKGILKTAGFGYDGKGQHVIEGPDEALVAWQELGASEAILEEKVAFTAELSVIVARTPEGLTATFPCAENLHKDHILDTTIAPACLPEAILREARELALSLAESLQVEGLLAVEMFLRSDGALLVNELAPRPHNSGHFSFDACVTSQFEQAVRAVCGLPLGSTDMLSPAAAMWNLLGHLWRSGEPNWAVALAEPRAKLHLYGKTAPRPGRKMGHITVLDTLPQAFETIKRISFELGDR